MVKCEPEREREREETRLTKNRSFLPAASREKRVVFGRVTQMRLASPRSLLGASAFLPCIPPYFSRAAKKQLWPSSAGDYASVLLSWIVISALMSASVVFCPRSKKKALSGFSLEVET
jgi:hypothetical protein